MERKYRCKRHYESQLREWAEEPEWWPWCTCPACITLSVLSVTHDKEPQRKSSPPGHSGQTSPALLLQFCLVSVFFSAARLSGLVSEPSPVPEMSTPSHSALDQHPGGSPSFPLDQPGRQLIFRQEESREKTEGFNGHLSPPPDCGGRGHKITKERRNTVTVLATCRAVGKNQSSASVSTTWPCHLCVTVSWSQIEYSLKSSFSGAPDTSQMLSPSAQAWSISTIPEGLLYGPGFTDTRGQAVSCLRG